MIDEKVLIERLGKLGWVYADYYPDETAIHRQRKKSVSYDAVVKIVKDLASEHNNGWISVEDALPEDGTEVLVYMTDYDEISVAWYNEVQKLFYSNDFPVDMSKYIIAWQPLPAPYKKGE